MNEKPGWYGISHLMEHLVCKSFDHLQDVYQQKNIKWNAYTSNTEVVFYMKGLDRHINEYKKENPEFSRNPDVNPKINLMQWGDLSW